MNFKPDYFDWAITWAINADTTDPTSGGVVHGVGEGRAETTAAAVGAGDDDDEKRNRVDSEQNMEADSAASPPSPGKCGRGPGGQGDAGGYAISGEPSGAAQGVCAGAGHIDRPHVFDVLLDPHADVLLALHLLGTVFHWLGGDLVYLGVRFAVDMRYIASGRRGRSG